MAIEKALTLIIPSNTTRDMNDQDLKNLLDTYALVDTAKSDFLAGRLSFQDYIDLLETAQVNIDSYLSTVENNLYLMKLI